MHPGRSCVFEILWLFELMNALFLELAEFTVAFLIKEYKAHLSILEGPQNSHLYDVERSPSKWYTLVKSLY